MDLRHYLETLLFLSLYHFLLTSRSCHAIDSATLTTTQFLRDGETITSPEGDYELGFFSPGNSTKRYVGIWFAKITIQTVVWVANRDTPLIDSFGIFKIREDGNLVVLDGKDDVLWSSNSSSASNTSIGVLLDNGNLILREQDSVKLEDVHWESFDHPTDTFLPGMKFGMNLKTGENQLLTSWKEANDPTSGNFSLGFDPNRIVQFVIWNSSIKSWRSGQWNGQLLTGVPEMTAFHLYGFNIFNDEDAGRVYCLYSNMNKSVISRFVLSPEGKLERSYWNNMALGWDVVWLQPNTECQLYGRCGPHGVCNHKGSPICSCLPGFSPLQPADWNSGNWSRGCVRNNPLECQDSKFGFKNGFLKLTNMKLPDNSVTVGGIEVTRDCEEKCNSNCSCVAYTYESGLGCLTWEGDMNDLQNFASDGVVLYIRLDKSDLQGGNKVKGPDLPIYGLDTVRIATDNFSTENKLGEGGFGPVYKGKIPSGQRIAVKRLSKGSGQGMLEFENEVILISKLQHRNLVRLFGCCIQGEEKMLIYEYMPNKSLDFFLFDQTKQHELDWKLRFYIIEGIARGLLYLHRDSRLRIIHRDLKVSNILLDEDMNPKISDFGMARIFGGNQNQENTMRVVGTYGYMAPEYAMEGLFSVKSDVFSFGVLLLEIVSGKRNAGFINPDKPLNLLGYAWELWRENMILNLADPSLGSLYSIDEISRCIQVGLLCVQDNPADRPSMDSVVLMLGSESTALPSPIRPSFSTSRTPRETDTCALGSELHFSANALSFSMEYGR
ncbi:hypothetical protein AQUCO_02700108v1 [Aquilegia coerulea]|uniref:Receptor-like serine/threonine-protein kinase n=1 Tax=Aquilegia coerulea TaxID=218851 RepID=A0A2G5D562_AQUCA|nr:hypothetical protein AQUCO_02700108v1 [Aquilegia coerulea]